MARKKRLVNKIEKKLFDKKCYFCSCDQYELLDVHRIVEGCEGGEYTAYNTVTVCSNCHRKIHAGFIRIDRKYFTSNGVWVLHYFDEENREHFD